MKIYYEGKNWLKDGFFQQGLWDFVQSTKEKLAQPLELPEYAVADEKKHLDEAKEYFQNNIYAHHHAFHNCVEQLNEGVNNIRPVQYGDNPQLYELSMFAARTLCNTEPVVYLFTAEKNGYTYQACALDYLDKAYIYISDVFFSANRILSSEEVLYLIGHELGHTQCHHVTLALADKEKKPRKKEEKLKKQEIERRKEYSADRAGMIACGCWLRKQNPDMPLDEIGRRCVRACIASLEKLTLGNRALYANAPADWHSFSYEELDAQIEQVFRKSKDLPQDTGTHPTHAHRLMAASNFAESEMFCKYIGLDPEQYRNLLNSKQLENAMYQL